MAKKVQKFQKYTQQEKEEYVTMYQEGKPSSYFERKLGISANTIRMRQYKVNHLELINGNKKGRQKKGLTKEDWKDMRYKKISGLPQGTTREKVTFINLYKDNFKFTNMYAVLNISFKTYYKYKNKEVSDYYN